MMNFLFGATGLTGRKAVLLIDIPNIDNPGEFLAHKDEVVTIIEYDDDNEVVIVQAENYSFPIEPSEAELVPLDDNDESDETWGTSPGYSEASGVWD